MGPAGGSCGWVIKEYCCIPISKLLNCFENIENLVCDLVNGAPRDLPYIHDITPILILYHTFLYDNWFLLYKSLYNRYAEMSDIMRNE